MNRIRRYTTIRFLIPISLLLLVTIALGLEYVTTRNVSRTQIQETQAEALRHTLNYLQSTTEVFLSTKSESIVQQSIANFAAEKDIISLIVTDPEGIVTASTRRADIGRHWNQLIHSPGYALVDQVIAGRQSYLYYDANEELLDGLTQICTVSATSLLRPSNCGFVHMRKDLAFHYEKYESLRRSGLLVSAIGTLIAAGILLVLLTINVTNKANSLIRSIVKFKTGNRDVRIKMSGFSELVALGTSINDLFVKINSTESEILEKQIRYGTLIDTMADGLITVTKEGIIESVNPSAQKLLRYGESELIGQNISIFEPQHKTERNSKEIIEYLPEIEKNAKSSFNEINVRVKDGSHLSVRLSISTMEINASWNYIIVISDISNLKDMETQLRSLNKKLQNSNDKLEETVITDSLTGLYNRRHFDQILEKELLRSTRHHHVLSLLMIDVDYFKQYNDTYGHAEGDNCLRLIGDCILGLFQRSGELPARYGGEEFAIILPGCDGMELQQRAELLRASIESLRISHSGSCIADHVTISIGAIASKPAAHEVIPPKPNAFFSLADKALYDAKARGRNMVVFSGFFPDTTSALVAKAFHIEQAPAKSTTEEVRKH